MHDSAYLRSQHQHQAHVSSDVGVRQLSLKMQQKESRCGGDGGVNMKGEQGQSCSKCAIRPKQDEVINPKGTTGSK